MQHLGTFPTDHRCVLISNLGRREGLVRQASAVQQGPLTVSCALCCWMWEHPAGVFVHISILFWRTQLLYSVVSLSDRSALKNSAILYMEERKKRFLLGEVQECLAPWPQYLVRHALFAFSLMFVPFLLTDLYPCFTRPGSGCQGVLSRQWLLQIPPHGKRHFLLDLCSV